MGCTVLCLLVATLGGVVVGSSMSSSIMTIRYAQGSGCTDPYQIGIMTEIYTQSTGCVYTYVLYMYVF